MHTVPRMRWRSGAVLVATALALSVSATSAPTAQAADVSWSCGLLTRTSWCLFSARHSYYTVTADYPGFGDVPVCEKTIDGSTGNDYQQACGNNIVEAFFEPIPDLKPAIGHLSLSSHTIIGYAAY